MLLIDDDEALAESLRHAFGTNDLAVDVVTTWGEGVGLFRVGLHELVIADYNLPGSMLGLKLLGAMKPLRPSARLILISGALTSRAQELIAGTSLVDRYIEKTSELHDELLAEAREAVRRSQEPTNWRLVAEAHLKSTRILDTDVDRIDQLLRGELHS